MPGFHFLFECAAGYALFEVFEAEEIAQSADRVRASAADVGGFSRGVRLTAFRAFEDELEALENALQVSEGELTDALRVFVENNVKVGKKDRTRYLGVADPKLASAIQDATGVPCRSNDVVNELCRGARAHLPHFVKGLDVAAAERAELGLGHAYSRARVKFNVHRQDNMIIQAIQLLDQMDKDINTNSMRVREWYGWHFPELNRTVTDPYLYARVVGVLKDRSRTCDADNRDATLAALADVAHDPDLAKRVMDLALTSMGMDVSDVDMLNISTFAARVEAQAKCRHELHAYLTGKMELVAPNLNALLGDAVGARLIAHAGSLTKLSKLPASTVQILGAEKALFRALKTKGNTPKFGLLFNSTFISRAATKNKGRISRYLANKCSLASRIDAYADAPTAAYGESLREQVEDRLDFYETGKVPKKNVDVMLAVKGRLGAAGAGAGAEVGVVAEAEAGDGEAQARKRRREEPDESGARGGESDEEDEDARRARKKAEKKARKQREAAAAAAGAGSPE